MLLRVDLGCYALANAANVTQSGNRPSIGLCHFPRFFFEKFCEGHANGVREPVSQFNCRNLPALQNAVNSSVRRACAFRQFALRHAAEFHGLAEAFSKVRRSLHVHGPYVTVNGN